MILVLHIVTLPVLAQIAYTGQEDIFAAKSFHFYGFDLTKLKIADGKRMGQNFRKFFPAFNELMLKQFNQKEFEIIFAKGKGNVPFNPEPTQSSIDKINHAAVVIQSSRTLSQDTISSVIATYKLPENSGLGSVVIFDCFDKAAMTVAVSIQFFDIATRKIIYSKSIVSKDKNGYNNMGDWKKASIRAMERLLKNAGEDFIAYKKEQKKLKKRTS